MKRTTSLKYTGLFILTTGLAASCNTEKEENSGDKLNFVIIYSDEMEADYLQCYNSESPYPTPHIDDLAEKGIVFSNAYTTSPMCTPSRFSVLTGKYPGKCESEEFLESYPYSEPYSVAWNTRIEGQIKTLPDHLSDAGYITGMAGKWHVGAEGLQDPAIPRFDPDDDLSDPEVNEKLKKHHEYYRNLVKETSGFDYANSVSWGNFDGFPFKKLAFHNIPWISRGASMFLSDRAADGKAFFLYVAPTAIHGPAHQASLDMDPAYTLEGKVEDVRNYDINRDSMKQVINNIPGPQQHKFAGLAYTDKIVGDIVRNLEENNLLENTVVIFTADHNVEPGKATCYEKGNKVPLIIRWPGKRMDQKNQQFIQNIDLTKTIVESSHNKQLPENELDGINIAHLLEKDGEPVRETIYLESGYARGIRKGQYKYIAYRPPQAAVESMKKGETDFAPNYLNTHKQGHSQIAMQHYPHYFDQDQLYDLEADPYEQNNLAYNKDYQEKLDEMKNEMQVYLNRFKHPFNLDPIPFLETDKYEKLTQNTRDIGTGFIEWLPRDHGEIIYPPENE